MADFDWTKERVEAAQLVAEGRLRDQVIAEKLGIGRRTLMTWKTLPEFAARIDELVEEFRKTVRKNSLAVLEYRVDALKDRHQRMLQIIDERAADPRFEGIAGGSTGLIVHNVKGVGKGDDFQLIDLYEVDTGLLKELREHEKQAAQELGQWSDKTEVKIDDDDDHNRDDLTRKIARLARPGSGRGMDEPIDETGDEGTSL